MERRRHARFYGREDVLAQLNKWLDGRGDTGWVVVTGGPGTGKSAILSAWLEQRQSVGPVPHHFIRRQVADWDHPEVIAASLAAQIEQMFPALRELNVKPERRLLELLGRVSVQLGSTRSLVVVVDGLNETQAEPGENPLPRFLPHAVPEGIRFLCATRATYPHLGWLEARSPVRRLDLDNPRWAPSNAAVVSGFWAAVASEYEPPLPLETMAMAIARAEGNILHAVMLHDALRGLPSEERRVDRIPRGLKALIGEVWDRAASHEAVRVGLGILCAAEEALSLDVLAEISRWSYDDKQRFMRDSRQLLLEEPAAWAGTDAYRLRHDWVREMVAEQLGPAAIRAHHATLSRTVATWPPRTGEAERRYALRHALIHRAEAGDWQRTWQLAGDTGFLEEKCRELGAHETEADVTRVAERCQGIGDATLSRRFADLARALARESHWLHVAPEALRALLWNRLRRFSWTTDDLDRELRLHVDDRFVRLRHAATRESSALVRDLVGHSDTVTACALTADDRRVVSVSRDRTLRVWDLDTGRALATLQGHSDGVRSCAVTSDGRVVSTSSDRTLKVWDLETGRALVTLEGHMDRVMACTLTPDGHTIISGAYDGVLKFWDLNTGRPLVTIDAHSDGVSACVVMPDGKRVVSASWDRTLKVWELETGRALATLEGHSGMVRACAVTTDGRLISASADRTLKIWDVERGRAVATLDGHTRGVSACTVTPDGRLLVSGSDDRTLKVWELDTGRVRSTLEGHIGGIWACATTADGGRLVTASEDRTLKIWNLESRRTHAAPDGHTAVVRECVVTADRRRVLSASEDGKLKVWDLESGRTLATLEGHTRGVTACAVTSDDRRVVSASEDRTLRIWDLESGRSLATLQGHTGTVVACAVTADGLHVVSASEDRTLKIWDLETGRALATMEGHIEAVMSCAVISETRQVISASYDHTLKTWDLDAGREIMTLKGHTDGIWTCATMGHGRRAVSASEDRTLKIWDLQSGRALATMQGHTDRVWACAITPDGRRVVSASSDQTLRVWEAATGRALATLQGHTGGVTACAVMADGRRLVSASSDRTLKVWDLDNYACLLTHHGDAPYSTVTSCANIIIAGDHSGGIWFLD